VAAVRLGIFVVPDATDPQLTLEQIETADRVGLDLVGVQDHPYQRRYFDTWTLLAYVAGRTERVRLVPDVINLPLRQPAVLAKSVASLDLLTGGRVELGIGAGSFWEAVEAMGGPRRTPGESVEALEEAIAILRGFWSGERSVTVEGRHHRVKGAKPGPPPAHPVGLWIGAYGPRMLRLTGRLGDGWLPSLGDHYLHPEDVAEAQAAIDEAARNAGRDPAEIERVANVMALTGPPGGWADELAPIATELGFRTLLVAPSADDPLGSIRRLGEETAPRLRELAG
jgi:alkanesulfonate monooxygenase SsuD/methylene tetrahydromethanopterin reductase-like flavin-dependent oxidoreductase (luciferase family)